MSTRAAFLNLLFAFALAWSGSAAQFHSFAHAQYDLAAASHGARAQAPLDRTPPPLKHSTDQCLVVHALDGTAAESGGLLAAERISQHVVRPVTQPGGESPAAAFHSRAPPLPA